MILAELDPRTHRLTFANAGHERPLIRRADGTVERLELPGSGLPLGVLADAAYAPTTIELEPGEVVVLHSDGLSDALDQQRRRFGPERIVQTLSNAPAGVSLASEALLEAVMQHADGAPALRRPDHRLLRPRVERDQVIRPVSSGLMAKSQSVIDHPP